jgi:hypothetical protein
LKSDLKLLKLSGLVAIMFITRPITLNHVVEHSLQCACQDGVRCIQNSDLQLFQYEGYLKIQCSLKQDWKSVIRTLIHTCILYKFRIINKTLRQLPYLDNLSFQLYKSRGLKVFLVNEEQYIIRRVCSVVAYRTHLYGFMGPIPSQVKYLFISCSHHVVILHFTKNCFLKVFVFSENL